MEIIKEGNKNKVDCYDCGSVLRFRPQDVTHKVEPPQGPYEFDSIERYAIECPISKTSIDVTNKISPAMGRQILELTQQKQYDDL